MQPLLPHVPALLSAQNVPVPIGLSPVIPEKPSSRLACVFVLILVLAGQQPSCKGPAACLGMAWLFYTPLFTWFCLKGLPFPSLYLPVDCRRRTAVHSISGKGTAQLPLGEWLRCTYPAQR